MDLETTGTWTEKDKIIELGMIKCMPDGRQESYVRRVNPGIPIPREVTQIVGIKDEDVKDAPSFKDIAKDALLFIGDADIGGFGVERFDLRVLERELVEAGLKFEWRDRVIYDAQKIYHLHERRDLTAAYQFYCSKDLVNAHTAFGDAQATLEILEAQIKKYVKDDDRIEALSGFDYEKTNEYFDKDRKFRWWNGELYPMFGKYARRYSVKKIAEKDPEYMNWILSSDFNDEVKGMVEGVLRGNYPKPPENEGSAPGKINSNHR